MSDAVDLIIAYKFVRLLSTPFNKWDAYELGLIDDKGIKLRTPETAEEKGALAGWKNLIRNIKRFIEKLPYGKTRLGSFAAALWLVKEETGIKDVTLLERELMGFLATTDLLLVEDTGDIINKVTAGKYMHDGDILYTPVDLEPIGRVFGENVFRVPEILTKQEHIVTWNDLTQL
jgi:hypothetical protein